MFVRQIRRLRLMKYETTVSPYFLNQKRFGFTDKSDPSEENAADKPPPPSLKQWRPHFDTKHRLATKLKIFDRGSRPSTDYIVILNGPWDLSRSGISRWWNRRMRDMEIYDQRFVKERHQILGSNLAASHFLVHRGGKVKFYGQSNWVEKNEKDEYSLPERYEPDWVLEAIDINGINLYYDGLLNLCYLSALKSMSLKGSKTIDDWCLDRISNQFPGLEHLDLSNCPRVSERGLEALYRMHSLRNLVVTNHHGSPSFELTCMMLEDCLPNLKVDVRAPEPEKPELEKPEPEKPELEKS